MSKSTAPEQDENYVRREIAPITNLLNAPSELSEFLKVVEEFKNILALYKPLSASNELGAIKIIEDVIDRVLKDDIRVTTCIPSARVSDKRETLRPHYEEHPHYCVYWHRCNQSYLQQQYRALLASFLPIQINLQRESKLKPKPFEDISYFVGLYLRQLSKPSREEEEIICQLPVYPLPPVQLKEHLEDLAKQYGTNFKASGDHKSFAYLYRVLLWYETGEWEKGLRNVHRSTRSHGAPRHGGRNNETKKEISRTDSFLQEDGRNLNTISYYADQINSREQPGADVDADPIRDGGKIGEIVEIPVQKATAFNEIDRMVLSRKKARYAAQAIEMSNQKLPITHSTLTGFELKTLLDTFADFSLGAWSDTPQELRPQIAAWGACRFYLSRGPNALTQMRVHADEKSPGAKVAIWYPKSQTIWLPCELPFHKPPENLSRVFIPKSGFNLDIAETLAPHMRRINAKRQAVFPRSLEEEFKALLAKINQTVGATFTPERIGTFMAGLMAQLAPNDEVISIYFRGIKPNQHNPCVYSAIPAARLASLFIQACDRVYEMAGIPRKVAATPAFPTMVSDEEIFVGSMHVPKLDIVRMTITSTRESIARKKNTAGTPIHELHNTYTAYVLLFLMATTGIRAVTKPIQAEFDVDKTSGCCFISEKDTDGYRNARVVWLHPIVIEQLDEYMRHATRLRQYISVANVDSLDKLDARQSMPLLSSRDAPNRTKDNDVLQNTTSPLFMLSEYGGHPIPIGPNKIREFLGENWELRLVSLRHFIRTQLLLSGCSGYVIDALFGHGNRGESPWGIFSTLPPTIWRKQLAERLAPILSQLDFEVVASPLLRS